MKKIKRIVCLFLAGLLCIGLLSCASKTHPVYVEADPPAAAQTTQAELRDVPADEPKEQDSLHALCQLERYREIPQHHIDEAARVTEQINQWKHQHPNSLIFGAVSDCHVNLLEPEYAHWSQAGVRHAAFALEAVGVLTACDFVVNLGDNAWESGIDQEATADAAAYTIDTLNASFTRLDAYHIPGNHDKSSDTGAQFDLIGGNNVYDSAAATPIRGYGFRDFPEHRVRVLFLNSVDYLNASGGYGMSYEQKDWLMRSLDLSEKLDANQWQILIISHIPLDFKYGDYNTYYDVQEILTSYVQGTSVSIAVEPAYAAGEEPSKYLCYDQGRLTYDYSGRNSAKIIANIHGHLHNNAVGIMEGSGLLRMATPNTSPYHNRIDAYLDAGSYSIRAESAQLLLKEESTSHDTAVTFYCIDLDAYIVYAFGYGANTDRVCSYGGAESCSISYDLKGATATPVVSTVPEGHALEIEVSGKGGEPLEAVTVTMGAQDITALCYADGIISIPHVLQDVHIQAVTGSHAAMINYFDASDPDFADKVRFNSSGETIEGSGFCSGFIPVKPGDVVRGYCPSGNYQTDKVGNNIRCLVVYNQNKEAIALLYPGETDGYLFDGTGFVYTVRQSQAAYVRVSGHLAGFYSDFVVTINHELPAPF